MAFGSMNSEGDDDVIGKAFLARTVVVQHITQPKPALLHQQLPEVSQAGRDLRDRPNGKEVTGY